MAMQQTFLEKNWKSILSVTLITVGVAVTVGYFLRPNPPAPVEKPAKKAKKAAKQAKSSPKLAQEKKQEGNALYSAKEYEKAIEKYSEAIELQESAVFYCNRAACYSNLKKYAEAVKDATKAIELDSKYIKAFHRRALAYEGLGDIRNALNEYTAVCALEGFKNQQSMAAPDRLLKLLATERAAQLWGEKVHQMPSETFISAYMDSFRKTPTDAKILKELEATTESDILLKQTFEYGTNQKWQLSLDSCNEAIEKDSFSTDALKAKALNHRATLNFLIGRVDDAVQDLEKSLALDPENINTLIKRATLFMERGDLEKTLEQFQKAEQLSSNHCDLYYHRGQVKFLTGDFQGAVQDYQTSLQTEKEGESSVYVHIQMGVALYKLGDIVGAEKKFRESKIKFPQSAEVWNYHGEILMDKQSFPEAENSFDKAIEMDPKSPLPYINKAILQMQWKNDSNQANIYCRKAIQVDPLCDIAYTQLAQLLCLQNNLDEAIEVYEKAIGIARTEAEIVNVIQCQEAARAQKYVVSAFPGLMSELRQD